MQMWRVVWIKIGFSTLCLVLHWHWAISQRPPNASLSIETATYRTTLWRHTRRLTIRTGHIVLGQELGLVWPTWGRHTWEAWRRYPSWGVSAHYFHLGEGAHRTAWGILPTLSIPLWRCRAWTARFRIGTGVGYVTHPYDSFDNPGENAVSSHWNNLTQFRLGLTYRIDKHWRFSTGASLTHLSNGAAKLPNFGINLPGYFFSLQLAPRGIEEETFRPAAEPNRAERRWRAALSASVARAEYLVIDGPKYLIWSGSASALYHLNALNRLTISLEGEYNPAIAEFGRQTGGFLNMRDARIGALRLALAPGAEFLFGPIGIHLQGGIYLGSHRINQILPAPWYSRLTTRCYLPQLVRRMPLRPWVGVALKAHRVNAEMIALQTGVVW